MKSYREVRRRYSFEQICFTPELCVEVTLQPVRSFDVDAAILFSDILFPLRILGVEVHFSDEGPILVHPKSAITLPNDYDEALLNLFDPVYSSVKVLKHILDRPLIGFAGAPFTLAAFLLEKQGHSGWSKTKNALLHDPNLFLSLIPVLEKIISAHLRFQIESGCQAVQIFDSLSGLVPQHLRASCIINPLKRILSALPPCPVIYFKATKDLLPELPQIPLSLGEDVDMNQLASNHNRVFQGNLNASFLSLPQHQLSPIINHICTLMKTHPGFIFNLSSGIPPNTSEETIKFLVSTVKTA